MIDDGVVIVVVPFNMYQYISYLFGLFGLAHFCAQLARGSKVFDNVALSFIHRVLNRRHGYIEP